MTGWNLPPGCNSSDIPGNTPEDEAWEKMLDRLAESGLGVNEIERRVFGVVLDADLKRRTKP